jgi:flagellum-specific peptidoglycan hydrolase FlgJ
MVVWHGVVMHASPEGISSARKVMALSDAQKQFIKDAAVAAQASEATTGVPASVIIAQAILESGWGKSHMGAANNYFGIKAFEKKGVVDVGPVATGFVDKSTKEFDNHGNAFFVIAHFRAYADMAGSFTDHGLFLKNGPRYATAMANYAQNKDASEFARDLQTAGYATDPNYASKLISIMTKNDLLKFNA